MSDTAKQALRQCASEFNTSVCDFLEQVAVVAPDNREHLDLARSEFQTRLAKNEVLFNLPAELSVSLFLPYLEIDAETGQVTAASLQNPAVNKFIHQIRSMFGDTQHASAAWDIPAFWGALPPEIQEVVLRYLTVFKNNLELYKQAKVQFGGTAQSQTPDLNGIMGPIIERIKSVMSEVKLSDFAEVKSMEDMLQHPKIRGILDKVLAQSPGTGSADSSSATTTPPPDFGALLNNVLPGLMSSMGTMFGEMGGGGDPSPGGASATEADPYITMLGNSSQITDMIKNMGALFSGGGAARRAPPVQAAAPVAAVTASSPSVSDFDLSDCVTAVRK